MCHVSRCHDVTLVQWDVATNLEARGGPVWDHVFVCEKGHYIPFSNLHPAVKVDISSDLEISNIYPDSISHFSR